jgi:hypothetical protein
MINEMRPIVWSERGANGASLAVTIRMQFSGVQRPMLTEHQILLPLQAQQLGRSYTGRLLVNVDITVREVGESGGVPRVHHTDVRDLCIGEIPVLVGSCLCHQPVSTVGSVAHFIVPVSVVVLRIAHEVHDDRVRGEGAQTPPQKVQEEAGPGVAPLLVAYVDHVPQQLEREGDGKQPRPPQASHGEQHETQHAAGGAETEQDHEHRGQYRGTEAHGTGRDHGAGILGCPETHWVFFYYFMLSSYHRHRRLSTGRTR